jgi:gamma-F420-2:alpha-L-glutamate ligase
MSARPVLWLIYNHLSLPVKRVRFAEEAEKVGFTVKEVLESDIVSLEVDAAQLKVHLKTKTGKVELAQPPAAAFAITGDHFLAPMATELMIQLEQLGVAVINTTTAREVAGNKWWTHQALAKYHLPTPRTFYLSKESAAVSYLARLVGYPAVLKAVYGTKGTSVWLCHDEQELLGQVSQLVPEREIIIQEYLANSHGRDVRVIVIDGQVVATMLRTAPTGKFHANLGAEGEGKPFTLTAEQQQLAVDATKAVGLRLAGVDLLFKEDNELVVGEVNSNPGLGIEQVCGVNVAGSVMKTLRQLL